MFGNLKNLFFRLSLDPKFLNLPKDPKKILILSGGITLLLCLASGLSHPSVETSDGRSHPGIDTFIPAGYVLVPIEIQNSEALDSVLGQHGVVDLYSASQDGSQKNRLVARALKILRAPLNPNQFAVLAREDKAPEIARNFEAFFVVIQNPNSPGTHIEMAKAKPKKLPKTQIVYGEPEVGTESLP